MSLKKFMIAKIKTSSFMKDDYANEMTYRLKNMMEIYILLLNNGHNKLEKVHIIEIRPSRYSIDT